MVELPSGTVTFLFTDVEGSTRLLKQLQRDRYGQVLAEHRRILRAAFEAHGGQEIDTQGDAFFVAFRKATDAALAAGAAQRALAEHPWPDGVEFRVRMGMHTGEPSLGEEGYHGLGVHRAARIMAAGHGGQILLSQATCSVLEDDELPGIALRDLGLHRFKDLDRPEHIFQLDIEGLPREFPHLRTAEAPTAYTGHEAELEKAARAVVWHARLRTRRWLAAAIAGFLVVGGLIAGLVLILGSSGTAQALSHVDANAVGLISSATGKISGEVAVGATPSYLAVGVGAFWVTNADDDTVSRIDPVTRTVVQTIAVGSSPSGITTGNGAVWVANSLDGTVSRIDPVKNTVVQPIRVGTVPSALSTRRARSGSRTPATTRSRRSMPTAGGRRRRCRSPLRSSSSVLEHCGRASGRRTAWRASIRPPDALCRRSRSGTAPPGSPSAAAPRGSRTPWTGPFLESIRQGIRLRRSFQPGTVQRPSQSARTASG